jgi:thiol-disulfide isomerase/thioredoxin
MDRDGDRVVSLAEYQGPRYMFDAFDLDGDGKVYAHELLAARRIDQFRSFAKPARLEERMEAARRFRREVPGEIPVLVDTMDDATAAAWGGLPNSAFVLARGGKVDTKLPWADAHAVDAALARLAGSAPPAAPPPLDSTLLRTSLAAAKKAGRPLLLHFVAPGCAACRAFDVTLATAPVQAALAKVHRVTLSVDDDPAWSLFESLGLGATPAFVSFTADGKPAARSQGAREPAAFLDFLAGK